MCESAVIPACSVARVQGGAPGRTAPSASVPSPRTAGRTRLGGPGRRLGHWGVVLY